MLDPGTDLRAAEGRRKHRFTLLDIQKLQRISFLLLTRQFRERRLVARQFDIREEAFQKYPDERIEPMDRRRDKCQKAPEIIPAANVPLLMAKPKYTGDNGAMIAGLAYYRRNVSGDDAMKIDVAPSLQVGDQS